MGDIQVKRGTVEQGRITSLVVGIYGLPDRTVDREQALQWMKDGHSLVPLVQGQRLPALQLVEVGDTWAIRTDNEPVEEDRLPPLPSS
jgi:hypothetical protein